MKEPDYMHHACALWQAITDGKMSAAQLKNELVASHENGKRDAQRWLPIADAPKDENGKHYWLWWRTRSGYPLRGYWDGLRWRAVGHGIINMDDGPEYYQPLPPPPEAGQ